jgi:hypothetical protein
VIRGQAWTAAALIAFACGGAASEEASETEPATEESVGQESAAIGPFAGIEPCELLTGTEIEAVTGVAPAVGKKSMEYGGSAPTCDWPSADGSQPMLAHLQVRGSGHTSYDDVVREFEDTFGSAEDLERVEGVGDFAAWNGPRDWGVLWVYSGSMMLEVSANPSPDRDRVEATRELAEMALLRLDEGQP